MRQLFAGSLFPGWAAVLTHVNQWEGKFPLRWHVSQRGSGHPALCSWAGTRAPVLSRAHGPDH